MEPIAVVGMSCRLPGASGPERFWRLLSRGESAVREVPPERWDITKLFDPDPSAPGKVYTRYGGFLDQVDGFDPEFFGISPREAAEMDPQQRLALELSWEAMEDAGLVPKHLAGSRTGVFLGFGVLEYSASRMTDLERITGYTLTGSVPCILANRVSYTFDFRGPSLSIDTACSSSLVAVHLACQSLGNGESALALAGGVSLMLAPGTSVGFSKLNALAPDGRCKAFDHRADGYGRGEGGGLVVLKTLSAAVADGDFIYAVIRGAAVNQDGRSNGLTAPSRWAQEAVLREAYSQAGISPGDVHYVETHGTGTLVGDPIEAMALGTVMADGRRKGDRCAIGSVKTNIGHLEAAAGVAGLIKVALSLHHRMIPPSLNFESPNPYIPFDELALEVSQTLTRWPDGRGPALAGVSSFGFGGTNAHVVLSEAPLRPTLPAPEPPRRAVHLLPLSARSPEALVAVTRSYRDFLRDDAAENGMDLVDICSGAGRTRSHLEYRCSISARTKEEAIGALEALLHSDARDKPARARVPRRRPKLVFVFSGQGAQYLGMGRMLYETEPTFRDIVTRCDELHRPLAGWSLLEALTETEAPSRLDRTDVAQPLIFAIQVALAALYRAWGIVPDALVGHSVGEVAAAYVGGALSLADAVTVVVHRGRLMQQATGHGRMAAVGLSREDAEQIAAGYEGRVWVAAINAPASTVLAGEAGALEAILASLNQRDIFCRDLGVNYAFHTPRMEPFRRELVEALGSIEPREPSIRIVSTVTGDDAANLDAAYWGNGITAPVRYHAAISRLVDEGHEVFLELGAHPVLRTPTTQCLARHGKAGTVLATLRRGQDDSESSLQTLGSLYRMGFEVDWAALYPGGARRLRLPSYPWQRKRHWNEGAHTGRASEPPTHRVVPGDDPAQEVQRRNVAGFYDSLSAVRGQSDGETFLTLAPFARPEPGFSWLLTLHEPDKRPEHAALLVKAQRELRDVLFGGIDWTSIRTVLDFGCGYGSDLIALARRHPGLELDGYTISPQQADIANRKIDDAGLGQRVRVYHRDSAREDFPGQYDLVLGFEVAPYIRDKRALFTNVDRHLNDGGFLLLADFVADTVSQIEHDATASTIITRDQWVELLSPLKLRAVECVDASREISNFLDDPDAEQRLSQWSDGPLRKHLASYDTLGRLLRKRLARYMLFKITKERRAAIEDIARTNRARIESPTPYGELTPGARGGDGLSDWLHEVAWRPAPRRRPSADGGAPDGRSWLIFADNGGVGRALAERLKSRQQNSLIVTPGEEYRLEGPEHLRIDPARDSDFHELIAKALPRGCRGIVHLWGLDGAPTERTTLRSLRADQETGSVCLLRLVQAIAGGRLGESLPRLWIVTRGAQSVDAAPVAVAQAPLWGLGRSIANEHPSLWGGLVDLDPNASAGAAALELFEEISSSDGEDQLVLREGARFAARLIKKRLAVGAPEPYRWASDRSYLITGGLGELGLRVAERMVERGARHVILLQRSELPPRSQWEAIEPDSKTGRQLAALRRLEAAGADSRVVAADVAAEAELEQALDQARKTMPPFAGVIHAAGVLDDGILTQLNPERFRRVLEAKLYGAWNVHRATEKDPLDFFVMFSSAAGLLGPPGQGNYAAANAGLDALAHYRRQKGLPALSIDWGPWADVGMAAGHSRRGGVIASRGVARIPPERGMHFLEELLAQEAPQLAVLSLDIEQWRTLRPTPPPLLAEMATAAKESAAPGETIVPVLLDLLGTEPSRRPAVLESYLREKVSSALQLSAIDLHQPLVEAGFDSLMALELSNRIALDLGVTVTVVDFLQGSTVAQLAVELVRKIGASYSDPELSRLTSVLERLNQMSEESVSTMLTEKRLSAKQRE